MMRLFYFDITNSNFYNVNGVDHNYTLMYSHGCNCGGFDDPNCIAKRCVAIDNFLVAGVFNSRYGWFNQGTTDGPSQHLQREFVSTLYNDTIENQIKEIGSAHMMSKIMTAPYVGIAGEFEPGAQRWVHYDCNVLGDVALKIWTDNPPPVTTEDLDQSVALSLFPNPAKDNLVLSITGKKDSFVRITFYNTLGQQVISSQETVLRFSGKQNINIDITSLQAGSYLCKVETDTFSQVRKLTVTK
jgi:hypothetical protein